jgi:hypothetical protein
VAPNHSSSPPDGRRLTGYNGVAKAKGWKISSPRNRFGGEISLLAENAHWTRENTASCAQRRHGVGATGHHLSKRSNKKWRSWTSMTEIQRIGKTAPARGQGPQTERLCAPQGQRPSSPAAEPRRVQHAASALYLPPLLHAELGILSGFFPRRDYYVSAHATCCLLAIGCCLLAVCACL